MQLWCYGAEFHAAVHNEMPSKPDWLSPLDRVALEYEVPRPHHVDSNGSQITYDQRLEKLPFRRFGCLVVCLSDAPESKW